jgi:hypothetical protein
VYFVNVTIFTIRFGDYSPETHLGRSFTFPMAVGGILFVGLTIGSVRTLVLEGGSRKISIRMVEVVRDNALRRHHRKAIREDDEMAKLERREEDFIIMRRIQLADGFKKPDYRTRYISKCLLHAVGYRSCCLLASRKSYGARGLESYQD